MRRLGLLGRGLVDPATPVVRADDRGMLLGDGCFDSIRVRPSGEPVGLNEHLGRFARGAATLEIPFDEAAWWALVGTVLAGWTGEAALRLTLTRGPEGGPPTGYATLSAVPPERVAQRRDGVRAVTVPRAIPVGPLAGVKTTSYAEAAAALRHAARLGAQDAIYVAPDGRVLEAPTATVVWLAGGTLCTPPAATLGLLPGVTVARLFRAAPGWDTAEVEATVADLHAADAVWLVSAVRLAAPVTALDGRPLATDPAATARVLAATGL